MFLFTDRKVLVELKEKGILVKTPSRPTTDSTISNYEDRFILRLATSKNGIVVSNDHFKDLLKEGEFKEAIEKRILPFTFYNDMYVSIIAVTTCLYSAKNSLAGYRPRKSSLFGVFSFQSDMQSNQASTKDSLIETSNP